MPTPIVLSIAGSDSGGGAGIQADIKAISANGGYACTVITALTAQNTQGVSAIETVSPGFIRQQLDSVFSDLDVQAVKIGMLGDRTTIEVVAQAMADYKPKALVLDPVMVATSGDLLLREDAVEALSTQLIPLADLITPNLYEARVLLAQPEQALPEDVAGLEQWARALAAFNPSVLLKGGHLGSASSDDVLYDHGEIYQLSAERIDTQNTHGTGCTLSSAIATELAKGHSMLQACERAKAYLSAAIANADRLNIGHGHGPVHHFYALDREVL